MVAHARHERHAIEDARRPQEEVIPVRPLVAAVDQVSRQHDEIGSRMTAIGRLEQSSPAFESRFGRHRDKGTERFVLDPVRF